MGNVFKAAVDKVAARKAHADECKLPECAQCERWLCWECKVNTVKSPLNGCFECGRKHRRRENAAAALRAVPRGFAEASLSGGWLVPLVGSKVIEQARDALSAVRVAAVGPPGSGKTSLVAAMVIAGGEAFDGKDYEPRWVSAHQLAKARATHPLGQGEAPLIAQALRCSLLVVDELGGEDARYASAVAEVLYERHAEDLPTWVTTGVGPKEIADRYGGGIARRVFEDATVFRLKGRGK